MIEQEKADAKLPNIFRVNELFDKRDRTFILRNVKNGQTFVYIKKRAQ
ncbi:MULTISPECIES: hypothetical protein [Bacillus]|nr:MULTISPECIES: hypothetical protein [Bacillus]WKB79456.1 hypothetical protein QYM22_11680 [Bacillus glycinifermentans]SCA86068.1 beta-lactamase [Bacillus glycinifermentans]